MRPRDEIALLQKNMDWHVTVLRKLRRRRDQIAKRLDRATEIRSYLRSFHPLYREAAKIARFPKKDKS